ncbi:hypothetical protein PLESTB_001211000 [Pleodorina starrii]|uniref:Uncharacterized protein n=1 Tax=Pleodorina starrii TaxID=330485 RepID=A0A9W6F6A4_9CHLO|nr:hypothetical protein PLESTM_001648100 [Pleodorina starrii]GLC57316.1 hypothetical protein PLESTB_001211000 [Pleodorina starrii]GLC71285.1 hypothetical protein PLESTF_001099000 [Pleodorina starrii]
MEASKIKDPHSTSRLVWHRAGTGRARELKGTAPTPTAVSGEALPSGSGTRGRREARPVALHTHSYTYVFSRLTHHTHRTQLQRAFCEGLYGAPPAEPNSAFYTELDERLRRQTSTLTAVRNKLAAESLAAAGRGGGGGEGQEQGYGDDEEDEEGVDTMALRRAVNSSLTRQIEFFTSCMERYCGTAPRPGPCACCPPGCSCGCVRQDGGPGGRGAPWRAASQAPQRHG